MIKYIKSVLWTVAKRLSYIEEARCLKVNIIPTISKRPPPTRVAPSSILTLVFVSIRLLLYMLQFLPIPYSFNYHLTRVSSFKCLASYNIHPFFSASFLNQTQSVKIFQESWPEDWQCCLRLPVVFPSLCNTSNAKMPLPSIDSLAISHVYKHRVTAIREIYEFIQK